MDFGLQLAGFSATEVVAMARKAEEWGYTAVYVPDHLAHERRDGGGLDDHAQVWDATTILGAIAVWKLSRRQHRRAAELGLA